jgi:hypothetical protein
MPLFVVRSYGIQVQHSYLPITARLHYLSFNLLMMYEVGQF